uniref:Prostate and testis expressed 2 n=1 Tax=Pongo abelii TaxID=9601 RepID=A0A8I5TTX5_PONAB
MFSGKGPRMFRLLLLGMFIVLFMDEGDRVLTWKWVRFCNFCKHFDGSICRGGMKSCWKFNIYLKNRSCATDHYYFSDLTTGRYLFRYTTLSCRPCDEGMFQVFHDLLRETTCCISQNRKLHPTEAPGCLFSFCWAQSFCSAHIGRLK